MRKLLTAALLLFAIGSFAQVNQYDEVEDSDPKAKALLDKIKAKYEAYHSLEAIFLLDVHLPDEPVETQKGIIFRQGDQYKVDLASQSVLSNGKAIWLILHNNKEVQINDVPDKEEDFSILSPQSLFNFYDKGQFVYTLVNEFVDKGKTLQQIEFKPIDRYSDYSKLRLTLEKNTYKITDIEAFSKDGSRFNFRFASLTPNKTFTDNFFTFDKSQYSGYHLEDLRE